MRNILIKISNTGDVLSATAFNALNDEMENIVESTDITLDPDGGPDTDLNMLAKSFASYANAGKTYDDIGAVNNYVPILASNLEIVAQLYDGIMAFFKAQNTNSGASLFAGIAFTRPDGSALSANDIIAGYYYLVSFNESSLRFELVSQERFATSAQIEAHTVSDRLVSPGDLKVVEDKYYPTGIIRSAPLDADIFGYLECDGSGYDTTTYAALFAVIGYTFGGAGATFNVPNIAEFYPDWVDQTAPSETWQGIAVDSSNGDVWICSSSNQEVYKRTGGVGSWVAQTAPSETWTDIAVDSSNGDVWICAGPQQNVYKRTGGVGSWVDQTAPSEEWTGIAVDSSNGDVWICSDTQQNVYKRTGGVGSWVDQTAPSEGWRDITVNSSNGDVWVCSGAQQNVYKRTGGVGSWVDQTAPSETWTDIAVDSSNGDVWNSATDAIYKALFLLEYIIKA